MKHLDKLVSKLPCLIELELCDLSGVTEEFLLTVARCCPSLTKLNLSNCKIEEIVDWKKVLHQFHCLQEVGQTATLRNNIL